MRSVAFLKNPQSLDTLAAETAAHWKSLQGHLRRTLAEAIQIGTLLNTAKEQLPHGSWRDWLQRCGGIPFRTAQVYMVLAKKSVPTEVTSIRNALAYLRNQKDTLERVTEVATADITLVCTRCDDATVRFPSKIGNWCSQCLMEHRREVKDRVLRWFRPLGAVDWNYGWGVKKLKGVRGKVLVERRHFVWPHSVWPREVLTLKNPEPLSMPAPQIPGHGDCCGPPLPIRRRVHVVRYLGEAVLVNGELLDKGILDSEGDVKFVEWNPALVFHSLFLTLANFAK